MTDSNVTITDIQIPFWRIVMILVKWSIAAIPALIVLAVIYSVVFATIIAILAMFGIEMPQQPMPQ